ncbi:hypothetical protein ACFUTV_00280 [Streptomyces sp. NPDC057298]|uniref:hypothetical protein n=1 Tax=Streptomyces sp. NPDC057298 TaxID=3346091 RepID=UPI00362658CC
MLSNKVAVITGGNSGIGLAAAKMGAIAGQGDASNPADLDRLYEAPFSYNYGERTSSAG